MSFFKQFPKIDYDFNREGSITQMVDIFRSVRPLPTFVDEFSGYKLYEIKDGERPDIVASRLYKNPKLYWTFFVVNDFLHDGYRSWPMSASALHSYIEKEYKGKVIEMETKMIGTTQVDSIAGKFTLGETITGQTSGATGKLIKKNVDMNQLIIDGGNFIGNMHESDGSREEIVGGTSTDRVSTYRVWNYADAPYYYYNENDGEKKPVTNALHITGGVASSDLAYQSYRNFEFERNEDRSKIRYVDPNYVERFVDKFEDLINV